MVAVLVMSGCVTGRASGVPAATAVPASGAVTAAERLADAFSSVADQVSPLVVSVRTETAADTPDPRRLPLPFFGSPFAPWPGPPDDGVQVGHGSGVIVRPGGYILTNHHVVEDATHIEVRLQDHRHFKAELVGSDAATDLAVLKIDATGLLAARFADDRDVRVGQWAVAIGSPFGLDYTITTGVVSAVGRGGFGTSEIEDYLQTDASINPGNSGGPLVNLRGEVIGINTMIVGRGTGIGFAIPSALAQAVADQLIESGAVRRAWLGVTFQELTPELAEHFESRGHAGALVSTVVPDGPAAEAGIRAGDVVVSIEGKELSESRDLLRYILRQKVGERVSVTVMRDGQRVTVSVTLGERPDSAPDARAGSAGEEDDFGLQLQSMTPDLARQLDLDEPGGVLVSGVAPGSRAAHAGLEPGDLIVEADRARVEAIADVRAALSDGSALLRVKRGAGFLFIVLR